MRRWRAAGLAAWACAAVLAPGPASAQDGQRPAIGVTWDARVTQVVDGDSIWARPEAGGARMRLRIDGIDAPEICQALGPEARAAMRALVLNQRVRVTVWAYDGYGRPLALVERVSDGADVAAQIVGQGLAWSEGYRGRLGKYWREEAQAREQDRGVFAGWRPETPAEFRRRHGPCTQPRR